MEKVSKGPKTIKPQRKACTKVNKRYVKFVKKGYTVCEISAQTDWNPMGFRRTEKRTSKHMSGIIRPIQQTKYKIIGFFYINHPTF